MPFALFFLRKRLSRSYTVYKGGSVMCRLSVSYAELDAPVGRYNIVSRGQGFCVVLCISLGPGQLPHSTRVGMGSAVCLLSCQVLKGLGTKTNISDRCAAVWSGVCNYVKVVTKAEKKDEGLTDGIKCSVHTVKRRLPCDPPHLAPPPSPRDQTSSQLPSSVIWCLV